MTDTAPAEQKKIVRIYSVFGLSLVASVIPEMTAAFFSLILGIGVLITAYTVRSASAKDSLTENHMTFIIRTIWIGSFFAISSMIAAALYLFAVLDNMVLIPCVERFAGTGVPVESDTALIMDMFGECFQTYWATNKQPLIIGGIIAAGPVLIYFIARFVRGITRASRGYRVANPKAWF